MSAGLGVVAGGVRKDRCTRFTGGTSDSSYCTFGTGVAAFDFERTDSFTVYLWVRFTQTSVGIMMARMGTAASARGWSTLVLGSGFSFILKSANTSNQLRMDTVSDFNDGKWHSVIVTYAGTSAPSGVHIYVDGNDESLTTTTNSLSATTKGSFNHLIGRDLIQDTFQFGGDVGAAAVFSGVLGSTDRATLHNGRRPPDKTATLAISGILGYWRMGAQISYPNVTDETGNGNTGLLQNTISEANSIKTYGPPYL